MAKGKWRTHLDATYWQLGAATRDVCLNCPLPGCVEVMRDVARHGLEMSDCPLPRTSTGTVLTGKGRRRYDVSAVAALLREQALTLHEIAERTNIPRTTLESWTKNGTLKAELRRVPGVRGRGVLFVVGVRA